MASTYERAEFARSTQMAALRRQHFICAMCGEPIGDLGEKGQPTHRFGEKGNAHHALPAKPLAPGEQGGPATEENCVIICRACHITAHQGGRWANLEIYDDMKGLAVPFRVKRCAKLYSYYDGDPKQDPHHDHHHRPA